jgi:hypothetical protein
MQSETKQDGSLKYWCNLEIEIDKHEELNLVFANHGEEDEIHPLTTIEIAKAQQKGWELKVYYKRNVKTPKEDIGFQLTEDTIVLCKNDKLIIPASLWHRAVSWYHHYLHEELHWRISGYKIKKNLFGSAYTTKVGRAGRTKSGFFPTPLPISSISSNAIFIEINPHGKDVAMNKPQAHSVGNTVARRQYLCVPLHCQNCKLSTPSEEKPPKKHQKTLQQWQILHCYQQ